MTFVTTFVSVHLGTFDMDLDYSQEVINKMLQKFPNGVYFHFFAGRQQEFMGNYDLVSC